MIDFSKFGSVVSISSYFDSQEKCLQAIIDERWGSDAVCPYCGKHHCHRGKSGRYSCTSCGNKFSPLVGTIFENTKIRLIKWFIAIYLVSSHKKGVSSCQLARDINVTQKTAWYMLSKIRTLFVQDGAPVNGDVELDECYIGGQEKWKHYAKHTKGTTGRSTKTKSCVFGIMKRGNGKYSHSHVFAFVVPNIAFYTLQKHIDRHCQYGTTLYTDECLAYSTLSAYGYHHYVIKHKAAQFVDGKIFTNNIEGFWAHLKRMITGIYHKVSKEHLQAYVDEECFRWNYRKTTQAHKFRMVLTKAMKGKCLYVDVVA